MSPSTQSTPVFSITAAIATAAAVSLVVVSLGAIVLFIWRRRRTNPPEVNEDDSNPVYGDYYFGDTDERIDEMKVEVSDNNLYYE